MSDRKRPAYNSNNSLFSNEKDDVRDRKKPALSLSDTLFGQQKMSPTVSSSDDDKVTKETNLKSPPETKTGDGLDFDVPKKPPPNSAALLFDSKKADDYKLASQLLREGNAHTLSHDDSDDIESYDTGENEDDDDMDDYYDEEEFLDPAKRILNNRILRHLNPSSIKALRIINMDLSTYWPRSSADCNSNGNGVARLPSKEITSVARAGKNSGCIYNDSDDEIPNDDEEVLAGRQRMAISMIATIFQEMGLIVLKPYISYDDEPKSDPSSELKLTNGDEFKNNPVVGNEKDSDTKTRSPPEDAYNGGSGAQVLSTNISSRQKIDIFPPDLMKELVKKAKDIEAEVCDRLDEVGEVWRADDDNDAPKKMPSRETATSETEVCQQKQRRQNQSTSFRYHEVAARCPGRLDVRWRMNEPPFNDPRVVSNHIILPIVNSLLGGTLPVGTGPNSGVGCSKGGGAVLTYAGLIYSFPDSSDQPWHMDGAALFPEEQSYLDLPPYALNVFIPLDDVTDELGPTEFLPASHLAAQAEQIDADLHEWAMHKSLAEMSTTASKGTAKPDFSENEWMDRHSVVAPCLEIGDVLIYDYRVCHRGTRNLSKMKTRPMLYLMYSRPWFKEHLNFGTERLFPQKNGVKECREM